MPRRPTQLCELSLDDRQDWLLEAGSQLIVLEGKVTLFQGLVWLAEHTVAAQQSLYAEQCWQAEREGWVTLIADRPCSLLILGPPPGWLSRAGRHLQAWLRGHDAPAAGEIKQS